MSSHTGAAQERLNQLDGLVISPAEDIAAAQVHATLAVADELRRGFDRLTAALRDQK